MEELWGLQVEEFGYNSSSGGRVEGLKAPHVGATGLIKPAGQRTASVSTAVHWTHMGTYLSGGMLAGINLRCACA
jgi:hypothetical protein